MSKVEQINSFARVKQKTSADINQLGMVVSDREESVSTASQTVINLSNFVVDQDQKTNFLLFIDGAGPLKETDDFTFTNVVNNVSSQITLTSPLAAGLNIVALRMGTQIATYPNPSSVQADLNNNVAQPLPWAKAGFTNFVVEEELTAIDGAPSTGQFRSDIRGRASILDQSKSLKSSMGIERIDAHSVSLLPKEFGPSGQSVFESQDKDARVRFVGNWINSSDSSGTHIRTFSSWSLATLDYIEVTFYGTGLNMLARESQFILNNDIEIDGASAGTVDTGGKNEVIGSRSYRVNQVVNITSGLSLGQHTVKIKAKTGNNDTHRICGFEILNEATSMKIFPGVAYAGTKEEELIALDSSAYDAGISGIRGARVVKYIKDNAISQVVQEAGSQLNLEAADHSDEEVIRRIKHREFGANKADDFSTLDSVTSDRAFTLDDGTTTLVCKDCRAGSTQNGMLTFYANGAYWSLTFVGTGLDILRDDNSAGGSDTFTLSIDGGTPIALPTAGDTTKRTTKLVSGLPYGTHTVKMLRVAVSTFAPRVDDFIIYGPKKPILPEGAIEICDYNVMADYVANSTVGVSTIPTGILRKMNIREFLYTGTWAAGAVQTDDYPSGFAVQGTSAGASVSYTFFGTGFEFRWQAFTNRPTAAVVDVDGETDFVSGSFGAVTTSAYGTGISFTAATGVLDQNDASLAVSGMSISGLPLDTHTVTVTSPSGTLDVGCFDVITPIHMNDTKRGSLALSDVRRFSPVPKEELEVDLSKAKALLSFDGVNNQVDFSHNISAVIDFATGNYMIYFKRPFKSRNYVRMVSSNQEMTFSGDDSQFPNRCNIRSKNSAGTQTDSFPNLACFGELENEEEE